MNTISATTQFGKLETTNELMSRLATALEYQMSYEKDLLGREDSTTREIYSSIMQSLERDGYYNN